MENQKSTARQISSASKNAIPGRRANIKMIQNIRLIWLDSSIDEDNSDFQNTITQLRRVVNDINTFTNGEKCIEFLESIQDNNVSMIISGSLGQQIVPHVHQMSQVDSIFIFYSNKKFHEEWAREWSKIKGVFTEIKPICDALKQVAQQCEQNSIAISFMTTNDDQSKKKLNQLEPSFMYTQIMKEIILTIDFEQKHFQQFIDYCEEALADNPDELQKIDQIRKTYRQKTPIWWYTLECFLYPMLNRALRTLDSALIVTLGFFIKDVHQQIEQLHQKQFNGDNFSKTFTAYRGQGMAKEEFQKMTQTKGGLISFNCFLSTSKERDISMRFAQNATKNPNLVGILFVMTIDQSQSTTPFAEIGSVGCYGDNEAEVLFSMHTIFRIKDITPMDENQRIFLVNLMLTTDNDPDLRVLTDNIREETFPYDEGWRRLALVLLKLGQSEEAEEIYQILLEQVTTEMEKAAIYQEIGGIKKYQRDYEEAIVYYEKSIEIREKMNFRDDHNLVSIYDDIGNAYQNMGEYSKALSFHEKALASYQQSLLPNHLDLAICYNNNIGLVYDLMGEYSEALSYYEKTLAIREQSLPPNHPDLAMAYNNIGIMYDIMDEYSEALSSHETALAIRQQSLSPNHPDLAASYGNLGMLYNNIGEYSKALSFFEKALAIDQQTLPPNHPDLGGGGTYQNIGLVYERMDNYSKTYSFYERALGIRQQSLPSTHPDLQTLKRMLDRVKNKL